MNKFIADIYRSATEDVKCHKYCSNYWMGNAKYKTMATFAFDFKNYYINFKKKKHNSESNSNFVLLY